MIQKKFLLGDNWLYYKVYSGPKTLEDILTQEIYRLIVDLTERGVIEKWFFIRYFDPDPHLRLRFFQSDNKNIGTLIMALLQIFQPFFDQRMIWKIETGTYIREIARYGENSIEIVEDYFCHESILLLDFFILSKKYEYNEEVRWLFAIKYIDFLLNSFNYSLDEKQHLIQQLQYNYLTMFGNSSTLKKQLAKKQRKTKSTVSDFMLSFEMDDKFLPLQKLLQNFGNNTKFLFEKILQMNADNSLSISLDNLNSSLIHMFMNRMFKSKNNLYELVCYDFLNKYYITEKYLS